MAKPTAKKPKKDRDEITVAKSIFDEIVEITEREPVEDSPKTRRAKIAAKARAKKLSPARRKSIAKKASAKRWEK